MSFIYIMYNVDWFENGKKYKFGYTDNLKDRLSQSHEQFSEKKKYIYIAELKRVGYPENVHIDKIFTNYKKNFKPLNEVKKYLVNGNGGKEFIYYDGLELFKKFIKDEIYNFKVKFIGEYTQEEIDEINESNSKSNSDGDSSSELQDFFDGLDLPEDNSINVNSNIIPHKIQNNVLEKCESLFEQYKKLKLIWSCGLGKTLMSLFIIQKMKFKTILIGVPSLNLADQFSDSIISYFQKEDYILIIGCGDNKTTYQHKIKEFYNKDLPIKFIITTYHSCYLLNNSYFKFDFKISDEAHHLASVKDKSNDKGCFLQFHDIISEYSLFMTATEKIIEYNGTKKESYSMDDTKYFGQYLDKVSIKQAIDQGFITDYYVLILKNHISNIDTIIEKLEIPNIDLYKQLFLSAYLSLRSINTNEGLSHLLIYCNSIEKADLVSQYIEQLITLDEFENLRENIYYESLHSNIKKTIKSELKDFKTSKYGIIPCVYIFGEGFDLPKLNGVVFAEQMQSEIRIVQSALRPNRKDKEQPNKIAYIIIPYSYGYSFTEDNQDFEKCRKIINQLGNHDESIKSKIKVIDTDSEGGGGCNRPKKIFNSKFKENQELLNQLIFKLIHRKSLNSGLTSEQDEYNFYREENKRFKYQSVSEYYTRKEENPQHLNNPEDYFKKCGVWKNYYDFIGRNNNDLLDLESWKLKCKELEIKTVDDYNQKIKIYNCLPPEPEYYYSSFRGILPELDISIVNTRRY